MKPTDTTLAIIVTAAMLILFGVLFALGQEGYTEADIDAAWSDGYQAYQIDTYLPKPNHKAPLPGLKVKVNG